MTERQLAMLLVEAHRKWELTYDDLWLATVYELRRMINEREYTDEPSEE